MIFDDTWETILKLSVKSGEGSLLPLFTFYMIHSEESPTIAEIHETTGLNNRVIKAGSDVLEELGFITRNIHKSNKRTVIVNDTPLSFSFVESISSIISSYRSIYTKPKSIRDDKTKLDKTKSNKFNLDDVQKDEDWLKMKPILLKYYKEYQIHEQLLVGPKQSFVKLCNLWDDLGEERFDAYAEWYRVNKYPYKKFNYGLFLYFGIISEFKDDTDAEDTRYMNTGSVGQSDSFKKKVSKTKESLREIIDSE